MGPVCHAPSTIRGVPGRFDTGPGPKRSAFLLAYAGVVIAGLFGAVIGYGWSEIGCRRDCNTDLAIGTIIGAIVGAVGTGVVAVLVLRAMAEWRRPD